MNEEKKAQRKWWKKVKKLAVKCFTLESFPTSGYIVDKSNRIIHKCTTARTYIIHISEDAVRKFIKEAFPLVEGIEYARICIDWDSEDKSEIEIC